MTKQNFDNKWWIGLVFSLISIIALMSAYTFNTHIEIIRSDISEIKKNTAVIPVIAERVESNKRRIGAIESDVDVLKKKVSLLELHNITQNGTVGVK